ncbi:MAG: MFS transporter, PPP family, 3-phenylpropionic acid transporter [Desulfobacteraceae bacterium Eth-SRB1]|nr:MAG: MFS transporter, PPP family, 3-phenylpropionic acid transporter [Desulfobacteraceae bacterium Eth-SRB1]
MKGKRKDLFKIIISFQYFLYFGIMGIFLPYFNLYCYHLGFSGFQIGTLSAVRTGATVIFPLFWGILADRFQIRKPIYILCNFISAFIWALYMYTADFWSMLVITTCYAIFYAPIISFLEAFTIDILGHEKKSYGRLRAWGSMAFIMVVVILGRIIDLFSIEVIIVLVFAGSLFQAFVSIKIPDTKNKKLLKKKSFSPIGNILLNRRLIIFLFCAFLMLVSHGAYYAFFSIHLANLGYGSTFIGITWALASTAEIIVMIKSDRIFKRFSLENVLVFSFVVAALRWFILFSATSTAVIMLTQTLHAITYGSFHIASILYIDSLTPDEAKTTGQAVNNAVTYGLGMTVGFFISGCLYETIGSFALFALSGFIALVGGVVFKGSQMIEDL